MNTQWLQWGLVLKFGKPTNNQKIIKYLCDLTETWGYSILIFLSILLIHISGKVSRLPKMYYEHLYLAYII